ncbi:hypothetical protein APHAL10511_001090 [Amanita phalloides]|nr:hypothetical protein APHAL10511_001090 [Amanita phalloides]
MDIFNLLPSPPLFFGQFLRLALSLLKSTVSTNYRRSIHRCSSVDFDVDSRTGFFPQHPLPRLTGVYEIWETALDHACQHLCLGTDTRPHNIDKHAFGYRWRHDIVAWPVFDVSWLNANTDLLRRAHYVLAWLVHFYVHSQPPNEESTKVVPKSLAVPLVQVSRRLGIAPVLTFADTVLWNCIPADPSQPLSMETMDNIRVMKVFSNTEDEKGFYISSAKAELRGIEMLRIFEDYRNLPDVDDLTTISKLSRDLIRLSKIIDDISDIIQNVRTNCDPEIFYQFVRPWFVGSDPSEGPRWIYEDVPESEQLDLSGPSAGQSSVMHALDIFLDIDHKQRHKRYPAPSDMNKRADRGFMERMRRYMPGKHREYLSQLASMPHSIRDVAAQTPALREPYDTAVAALKRLRDLHLRIACLYIVTMSHKCPMMKRTHKATGPIRGTGGNEVSILLKTGRDNTQRGMFRLR